MNNAQPFPENLILENTFVKLEALAAQHASPLAAAAADGALWQNRFAKIPAPGEEAAYIEKARAGNGSKGFAFAVLDKERARFVGSTRFYNYEADNSHIMIGYTWFAVSAQGGRVNPAAKLLLLRYAFEELACEAAEFQVDILNTHSRAAVLKLGAREDGILRAHKRRPDGTMRDTVSFSIIKSEWPDVRARLEARLS